MARLGVALAGAAVGGAIAGPVGLQVGFSIGLAAGNYFFGPEVPPQEGPKLEDAKVSSSAYGLMIPIVYGTIDVSGNIIDAGELITIKNKEETGGKGGPSQEVITYTQFMDFDIALNTGCEGIIQIFANEKLIYDATPGSTVKAPDWLDWVFYDGAETQDPDPTFEATRGVDEVPGYRGTSHVVFRRFKVTEFGTTAITFRFVVTTSGSGSTSEVRYEQDGIGFAPDIIHAQYADLMVGTINRDITGTSETQELMLVAFDPYARTQVWSAYINNGNSFGKAYWIDECSFFETDAAGAPKYAPRQFLVVSHRRNVSFPRERYLRFFYADSGAELGILAMSDSDGAEKMVSVYTDDAVIYQLTVSGSTVGLKRHYCTETPTISTASIDPPAEYLWYGDQNNPMWAKKGSRFTGESPVILCGVEHDTTGDNGYTIWQDKEPGLGATSVTPNFSTPVEFTAAHGAINDGIYDPNEDCFWVLTATTNSFIHRIETDGTLTSSSDWNTLFSITGEAVSITLDTSKDKLWVVIAGVAYAWPTYDLTQTPVSYGSGLQAAALAWHPYSGTLFAGYTQDTVTPDYWQYDLDNLTGGGETLQSVVEDICDQAGTNLLTADRSCTALSSITVAGFRIAQIAQRRAAIDALRNTYLFDFVPRSGVLTAVVRDGASAATLDQDDIGAHVYGSNAPPELTISRDAEDKTPKLVGVNFIDSTQNYDPGYEAATRLASAGGTELRTDNAVVLTHDEGAQLASVLLHSRNIEAEKYEARLMPSQRDVAVPAAIVTIETNSIQYPMRIDESNIIDGGIIEIRGARHDASVYSDFQVGGTTRDRNRSVTQIGTTQLVVLDAPAFQQADLNAGYYIAGTSYTPEWPGAVVYESADGTNFSQSATLTNEAVYGFVTDELASGEQTDLANSVEVRLVEGSLASISDTVMQTGATSNYAAIGASGRWEIVKFQTVSETNGLYTLSGFYRGLRDTQDSIGTSVIGDKFVLLDRDTLGRVLIDSTYLSTTRWVKGVTIGRPIDDATTQTLVPTGKALLPFRPASLHAYLSTGDWIIEWNRQDKKQAGFLKQPEMSESTESYSVQITNSLGTAVRTITATSETATYTSAQQTTDFGGAVSLLRFQVAQVSAVVGAGPYQSGYAGSYSIDYDALVTGRGALIDFWAMDETSGTNAASDSGSNDGTYIDSPTLNSTALLLDGSPSVFFNVPTEYVDVTPFAAAANTRSAQFAVKPVVITGTDKMDLLWVTSSLGGGNAFRIDLQTNLKLRLRLYNGTATTTLEADTALTVGETYIITCNFGPTSGDDCEIWINETLDASTTTQATVTFPTTGYFRFCKAVSGTPDVNFSKLTIYDTAQTQGEISENVLRGFGI